VSHRARTLALVALSLLCPGVAHAQPAWLRTALLIPSPPALAKSDGAVLFDRTELVIDEHLRIRRHEMRAIRILRPAGVDLAAFAFAIEPGGKRDKVQAWTIGKDRMEQSSDRDVAESTLDPEHYSDVRRVIVNAPTPRVGDTIGVEFTSEEQLPFAFYTWSPQFRAMPVARAELDVELPAGWTLDTRASGFALQDAGAAGRAHAFGAGPLAGIPDEANSPPARMVLPYAMLRFSAPSGASAGAMKDWQGVARWYHGLAAPHFASANVPPDLMARANTRTTGTKLSSLAGEVQHQVGYAAIELGQQRWEPDAARDTWTRHYGDCKDKSVLLVAVLAASGIEARPVLACTREAGAVDPEWPDPGQFNHCIVAIAGTDAPHDSSRASVRGPSGKTWFLFDPTDTGTPLGLLPWSLGGTYAVIADPNEGLVQMPAVDPGRIGLGLKGRLDESGAFAGTVHLAAERAAVGWLTSQYGDASEQTRGERLATLLSAAGLHAETSNVRWLGVDSLAFRAALEADVTMTGLTRRAGQTLLLTPPFPMLRHTPPPADSTRTIAVWMGWSPVLDARLDVELPAGYGARPQAAMSATGPIGDYKLSAEETSGRLVIERHLAIHMESVPAARWNEARALLQTIYRGDNAPVLLKAR
jgi:hypothetical protein